MRERETERERDYVCLSGGQMKAETKIQILIINFTGYTV